MQKPAHLMIAIGLPRAEEAPDEDGLNRERGGDSDDDIATEAIVSIVHRVHQGGPSAVRDLRKFTQALEDMCEQFMAKDRAGYEAAACEARDALENMISG
jgi:hypothetical protein